MATEYGLFNPEGCWEAGMWSQAEAEKAQADWRAENPDEEDFECEVSAICSEHDGERAGYCSKCDADADEDEQDEDDAAEWDAGIGELLRLRSEQSNQGEATTPEAREAWEGCAFADLAIGDQVRFLTRDTGFGGTFESKERTGWVVRCSPGHVVVKVRGGFGETARIRPVEMLERCVYRRTGGHVPYHPDFVHYVDTPGQITALWSPVPIQDPKYVLAHITDRSRFDSVEVVAEANRFTKRDGAVYPGWVVRSGVDHSEPLTLKADALRSLDSAVAEYFKGTKNYI